MKNINYMCEAKYSNGAKKLHYTSTEQAARNWANRQFSKDEDVTVIIYDANGELVCIYHA